MFQSPVGTVVLIFKFWVVETIPSWNTFRCCLYFNQSVGQH